MSAWNMRWLPFVTLATLAAACAATRPTATTAPSDPRLAAAEALVDAFYSFDPGRLRRAMSGAASSVPKILYYQGWAEGGNYVVVERKPCRASTADEVRCDITVRDDLIGALGTGYNVTDSFHLKFHGREIAAVRTTSNDPPEFDQALEWLRAQRPELISGACQGFFAGGPTPGDCARAVVKGFAEFAAGRQR